jgi:hypothetical protein
VKATFWFTEEDIRNMLLERWGPRTAVYDQDGPRPGHKLQIVSLHLYSEGGWVEFSDELPTEVPVAPPEYKPLKEDDHDDKIPF